MNVIKEQFWNEIEEPIRDIVKYLRDNGINTTCSCGHEMTIQADVQVSGWLMLLHNSLFNYFSEKGIEQDYEIVAHVEVVNGRLWRSWADIKIGNSERGVQECRDGKR